jgi:hypothetical protein
MVMFNAHSAMFFEKLRDIRTGEKGVTEGNEVNEGVGI